MEEKTYIDYSKISYIGKYSFVIDGVELLLNSRGAPTREEWRMGWRD